MGRRFSNVVTFLRPLQGRFFFILNPRLRFPAFGVQTWPGASGFCPFGAWCGCLSELVDGEIRVQLIKKFYRFVGKQPLPNPPRKRGGNMPLVLSHADKRVVCATRGVTAVDPAKAGPNASRFRSVGEG